MMAPLMEPVDTNPEVAPTIAPLSMGAIFPKAAGMCTAMTMAMMIRWCSLMNSTTFLTSLVTALTAFLRSLPMLLKSFLKK